MTKGTKQVKTAKHPKQWGNTAQHSRVGAQLRQVFLHVVQVKDKDLKKNMEVAYGCSQIVPSKH